MAKTKRKRRGGQPSHDAARKGVKPPKKRPTESGEAWRHVEVRPDGTMRVRFEYITHADAGEELSVQIVSAMFGAARNVDLRTLAQQHPEQVEHGAILTPDGTFVVESWIPRANELLILKGRPSTMDDLATLEVYGEPAETTEARKAEARRRIEEAGPSRESHPTLALPDKRIVGPDGKPIEPRSRP